MSPIDILALIFAIIVVVKMGSLFLMPKWMSSFADKILSQSSMLLSGISVIFIVIVGYFVLTQLSVQNILAVMLFTHILIGLLLLQYPKEITTLTKKILQDKFKFWLSALIYAALSLWGLIVILA